MGLLFYQGFTLYFSCEQTEHEQKLVNSETTAVCKNWSSGVVTWQPNDYHNIHTLKMILRLQFYKENLLTYNCVTRNCGKTRCERRVFFYLRSDDILMKSYKLLHLFDNILSDPSD